MDYSVQFWIDLTHISLEDTGTDSQTLFFEEVSFVLADLGKSGEASKMSKMIDPLFTGWWLNQLKNISQSTGVKIPKNIWNHHLVNNWTPCFTYFHCFAVSLFTINSTIQRSVVLFTWSLANTFPMKKGVFLWTPEFFIFYSGNLTSSNSHRTKPFTSKKTLRKFKTLFMKPQFLGWRVHQPNHPPSVFWSFGRSWQTCKSSDNLSWSVELNLYRQTLPKTGFIYVWFKIICGLNSENAFDESRRETLRRL